MLYLCAHSMLLTSWWQFEYVLVYCVTHFEPDEELLPRLGLKSILSLIMVNKDMQNYICVTIYTLKNAVFEST